jgi:hypothetical protein
MASPHPAEGLILSARPVPHQRQWHGGRLGAGRTTATWRCGGALWLIWRRTRIASRTRFSSTPSPSGLSRVGSSPTTCAFGAPRVCSLPLCACARGRLRAERWWRCAGKGVGLKVRARSWLPALFRFSDWPIICLSGRRSPTRMKLEAARTNAVAGRRANRASWTRLAAILDQFQRYLGAL